MAKASFAVKDAAETIGGFQEGNFEITGSKIMVHQYQPREDAKDKKVNPPALGAMLTLQLFDDDWNPIEGEAGQVEKFLGCGKTAMEYFHVGNADSAEDDDPSDEGVEVNTEGNCLYAVKDTAKLNKGCAYLKFTGSLESCGFKPEVLANGYAPDLVGLRAHAVTVKTGSGKGDDGKERDYTAFTVDKIETFPYEAKKGKGKAGKVEEKAKAGKAEDKGKAGKEKPAEKSKAAAKADDGDGDNEGYALAILGKVIEGNAGETIPLAKWGVKCQTLVMNKSNGIPAAQHSAVTKILKDGDWLAAQSEELSTFIFDAEEKAITIPGE